MATYAEANRGLPKFTELQERFANWFTVESNDQASAWTFVMAARGRDWMVSDPSPNSDGVRCTVFVWSKGVVDGHAIGRARRS